MNLRRGSSGARGRMCRAQPRPRGAFTMTFTFVNKWLGTDGRDFILVPTKDAPWATIGGKFLLE